MRLGCAVWLLVGVAFGTARAQVSPPPEDPARELALLMRGLDRTARVLYVTAHPDDEDAGLLARLHYGEGVETMLLTVTRGEGGQNEIGTELFSALGVLRSRELEAAARYTGASQAFTRAFEFGYSFSVEETFEKWDHDAILRDIVRVVRSFRPDVILTLPHVGDGGGQHHQATARLAAESFARAAGDEWPALGPPHRTRRLFRVLWRDDEHVENHCNMELGVYDPVLGASYAEMGLASRAAHKCQGMASLFDPFPSRRSRWEWRLASDEEPHAVTHLLDELPEPLLEDANGETAFGRELRARVGEARAAYAIDGGDALSGALLEVYDVVSRALEAAADADARVRLETLRARTARAVLLSSGVRLTARANARDVARGDTLLVTVEARNTGGKPAGVDPTLVGRGTAACRVIRLDRRDAVGGTGRLAMTERGPTLRLESGASGSAHYALIVGEEAEPTIAMPVPRHGADVDDETARRWLHPAWRAVELSAVLDVSGRRVVLPRIPISCQELDAAFPSVVYSDPHIVPDPSVRFAREVVPLPEREGVKRRAGLDLLVSSLHGGPVRVVLDAPSGWVVEEGREGAVVETGTGGTEVPLHLTLRAPADAEPVTVRARAWREGLEEPRVSSRGVRRVTYPHIRPGALLVDASVEVTPFVCRVPSGVRLGYVEGAGDEVAVALEALGLAPVPLTTEDLLEGDLGRFDTIVTGVRAYKVREDLAAAQDRMMAWVRAGGALIVQYNKLELNAGAAESPYAPYPGARVGHRRVTVEESPVVVNVPEHPVFNLPNRIGPDDWAGWVQERGLYFLDVDDPHYTDLVTLEDPWPYNAGPKGGALVAAPVGEGVWVYVGLGLFRQLPAGVPGAFRLLANLVALGGDR